MTTPTNLERRESGLSFLQMCLERRDVLCSVILKENASNIYTGRRELCYEWCDGQNAKRNFQSAIPLIERVSVQSSMNPLIYIAIFWGNYYSSLRAILTHK